MSNTLKMLEKITICNDCKYCTRKILNSAIFREESFDVYFLNNAGKHLIYGKHFYQIVAVQSRRTKKVNLHQARKKDRSDSQHTRYRHLYQARRATGDVLSQVSYLETNVSKALFSKGELPLLTNF